METYARGGLWPSCLRITLARENQSAVVRLTTGNVVCLCFFRLDNANVPAQEWQLGSMEACAYTSLVEHEEAYPYV